MNYIKKIGLHEIKNTLSKKVALILFASFEKRCMTLAREIDIDIIEKAYVFRNIDNPMCMYNAGNLKAIQERIPRASIVEVSLNNPVLVADVFFSIIIEIRNANIKNIVIDISTFTHETLLMLIKSLYVNRTFFDTIALVYNGASKYSDWLSKGCKSIRNVVGYPGFFIPSYKDHMIILTGFEKERATQLVELFEPDILSIGNGCDPTSVDHQTMMEEMKEQFIEWSENLGSILSSPFDFSCSDICATMTKIEDIVNRGTKENIILVPLNTKLSTVSVALIALKTPSIQVLYPVPETYNILYSEPSDSFTVIDLKRISDFND